MSDRATIKELPAHLADIEDPEHVRELMADDERVSARPIYEARLDELFEEAGIVVTRWKGLPNYECPRCPYASLKREKTLDHIRDNHPDVRL